MKFYKINDPIYVQDLFVSLASRLPHNLIVPANKADFIFRLGDEGIEKLCKEAMKKDAHKPLYASLYTKPEDSDKCPHQFNYDSFDWHNVVKVEISGDTIDTWDNRLKFQFQYISIVFVTKAN